MDAKPFVSLLFMIKIKERYFIKIVPARGETVHRFELTRRRIVAAATALTVLLAICVSFGVAGVVRARAQVAALSDIAARQRMQLQTIDKRTTAIRSQLRHVQQQNQEIQQLIGEPAKPPRGIQNTSAISAPHATRPRFALVARHVDALAEVTAQTAQQSDRLRRLTMHVLNVRRLENLARARLIASIPSIDPVDGAPIVGCFCYRSEPDAEFHPGVDLGANYGDTVHAAAAGTIASAGWDGGYGIKIDIDHGNGYHTWYAHLSQMDVHPGEYVHKGEAIGLVGSTGFSTGPHLHYQVMHNGTAIDPSPFLDGVPANVLASLQ